MRRNGLRSHILIVEDSNTDGLAEGLETLLDRPRSERPLPGKTNKVRAVDPKVVPFTVLEEAQEVVSGELHGRCPNSTPGCGMHVPEKFALRYIRAGIPLNPKALECQSLI